MSIIDYSTGFIYDKSKTTKELAIEYYNKYRNNLEFYIGDNVKINLASNAPTSLIKLFEDKIFQIIGVDMDYNFSNPLSYILNTGIEITLFKAENLIKIEEK